MWFDGSVDYPPPTAEALRVRGGGVYALTDAQGRLIQLSSAGNLARALAVRLEGASAGPEERPTARRRADLRAVVRRVWWKQAHSAFEIHYQYLRIARALLPGEYLRHLAFGPCGFVHLDPSAEFPRLATGSILRGPPGVDLGPLPTLREARQLVQMLEDGFDLCRYPHILEQAPHGRPCAYFDMGRCPAPCTGRVSMDHYRHVVAAALAFAAGRRSDVYRQLELQMRQAAAALAFERAAALKQARDRLRGIEGRSFQHLRPVESLKYLVVQRGRTPRWVTPFFVRAGRILPGRSVPLKALAPAVPGWRRQVLDADAEAGPLPEPPEPSGDRSHAAPGDRGVVCDQNPATEAVQPAEAAVVRPYDQQGRAEGNPTLRGEPASAPEELPAAGTVAAPHDDLQFRSEQIWLLAHFLFRKDPPGLFLPGETLPDEVALCDLIRTHFETPLATGEASDQDIDPSPGPL